MEEAAQTSKSALKKAAKMAGKAEKAAKQIPVVGGKKDDSKEIIGMTASKEANFSQWYQELVVKGEMVEYYSEVSEYAQDTPNILKLTTNLVLDFWFLHSPT